jgi:hypothetical protein
MDLNTLFGILLQDGRATSLMSNIAKEHIAKEQSKATGQEKG